MEFEGRRRSKNELNLTPLIDLVFLLLVFFLLTADFINSERIPIDLPKAQSATPPSGQELMVVSINNRGELFFQGVLVDPAELESKLKARIDSGGGTTVSLRGDKDAALAVVVGALEASRRAGAESVEVVTERP